MEPFDAVRSVDELTNLRRKVKVRRELQPVAFPRANDEGILLLPRLPNRRESHYHFLQCVGLVHGLEGSHNGQRVLFRDIFDCVTEQMDDARLHARHGKDLCTASEKVIKKQINSS